MIDHLVINRDLVSRLSTWNNEALRVFLCLVDRAQEQESIKIGLTLHELARIADISVARAKEALIFLVAEGCIYSEKQGKHSVIKLSEYWVKDATPIPYTAENTDDTKIKKVEEELRRLERRHRSSVLKQKSGLIDVLQGEEQTLIRDIETYQGHGLSPIDTYLLGKAVARFGPDRVRQTWRQMRQSKNPIRAIYASLQRGIKGQGAKLQESEPFEKVHYQELS